MKTRIVVPWHNPNQRDAFLKAWNIKSDDPLLLLEQDGGWKQGARTTNNGVKRAMEEGAEIVCVLNDDCFPSDSVHSLPRFAKLHEDALRPREIPLFKVITDPPNRGTPYYARTITMPVACSIGFWTVIPDWDAPSQLVRGATAPMEFKREPVFGQYFAMCGMNLAFRVKDWWPWCQLVEGAFRMDDIWMGFMWQHEAYRRHCCFALDGPIVEHSRQSNVWVNLRDEAQRMEANETIWQKIALSPETSYEALRALLPL